ncbi:cyclic nucleotide-binding-like protein, partial [Cladochytrium replicatum]
MLALKLRPVQFRQHELIIKKGDIAQELYFVVRGVAEVFGEEDGKVYAQFQPGSFFGEVGLLHEVKRTASVRAVTSVINVFRLTKEDLDEVLKEYPEINEKIKEEARQRFRFNELREKAKLEKDTAVQTELEVVREMLKNVPLFKNGPVGFLHELALSLKLNSAKPDDEIIKKGDIGQSMFFVMEGIADVTSEDGKVLYAEIPSNSFFGEVALFYDVPRTASVRARTRCTLFELSKDALHHVLSHNADLKSAMEVTAAENFKLFQSRQAAVEKIGKRSEAKSTEAFSVEVITDRLKKVPIFSHCDDGFLRTLALTTSIHVFKLGDLVVRKGDTS